MGHQNFSANVERAIRPVLRRLIERGDLDFKLKIKLSGDKVPWPVNMRGHLTAEEQYIHRLHSLTTEVLESYQAMRNVEVYLRRLPFTSVGVAPSVYIRSQLESFFNEMYILQGRMKTFNVKIGREFRRDPGARCPNEHVKYVRDEMEHRFEPLRSLRGRHVHEARYDDAELRRLSLLELLAEVDLKAFGPHARRASRSARANAQTFVTDINRGLASKLDRFFDYFQGLVFKKDGSIRIPANLRAA